MLNMKSGCKVPFPEKLEEAYQTKENVITANIGIDNIEAVMQHFIVMHEEPLFFILELPTNANDEIQIRQGLHHKDVYYIDGCSQNEAIAILMRVGDILFNDGLAEFGYGGHESGDEIMFGKYNILTIFSNNTEQYDEFFEAHGIKKVSELVTAWDTFSQEHPGFSKRITVAGKDIYSIPEQFKESGMYFAERREE